MLPESFEDRRDLLDRVAHPDCYPDFRDYPDHCPPLTPIASANNMSVWDSPTIPLEHHNPRVHRYDLHTTDMCTSHLIPAPVLRQTAQVLDITPLDAETICVRETYFRHNLLGIDSPLPPTEQLAPLARMALLRILMDKDCGLEPVRW